MTPNYPPSKPDDKSARAELGDARVSLYPGREDPGATPRNPAHAGGKEHHVLPESSEDEIDEANEEQDQIPRGSDPEKTNSRPQSERGTSFADTSPVPRAQRRGLFARLTVIPEVEQPYKYKNKTKWTITAIVALAAAGAPMGSGIFLRKSVLSQISRVVADLMLS
jgi:hypothetical protein